MNYKIDYINSTIIVNKTFLKKAGTFGTKEYKELMALRHDMPDFQIVAKEIKKKESKRSYGKLTIPKMREFIIVKCGEKSTTMVEFDRFCEITHITAGAAYYSKVKSWFLTQFADEFNANGEEEETAVA